MRERERKKRGRGRVEREREMNETQSFLVLHEVIHPKLFISLFILVGVSRNLPEEAFPFDLFVCFVWGKFDSIAHVLKGASAFGFKPSSPWRAVLWVLVFIVWDKVQSFLPRPLWGQNSLSWARDLLMCPWSYILWATCFVPRAPLVISRLEYILFKTQQVEK